MDLKLFNFKISIKSKISKISIKSKISKVSIKSKISKISLLLILKMFYDQTFQC